MVIQCIDIPTKRSESTVQLTHFVVYLSSTVI